MSVERWSLNLFVMADLPELAGFHGPDLLLRVNGERAFAILEAALVGVAQGSALTLDFAGTGVMDGSFADASVLQLLAGLVDDRYGDRFLILQGIDADTIENLEGAMARRRSKLAVLVRNGSRLWIIGHLEQNLLEAWELAVQGGTITARDLADRLGLEINT